MNFDAGMVEGTVRGWGFLIRDNDGDVVMASVDQQLGFQGADLEEAGACLFAMKKALGHGFRKIVMEGDCFTPVSYTHLTLPTNREV